MITGGNIWEYLGILQFDLDQRGHDWIQINPQFKIYLK